MSIKLERFDSTGDPSEIGARWNLWVERFKVMCDANDWNEDSAAKKKSKFLSFFDTDSFTVYAGLKKADNTDTFEQVIKFMTDYYNPSRSHFASRFAFNQLNQKDDESTSAFAARLKRQAALCNFGNDTDARILEQLVAGSGNNDFKQYCLTNRELDLVKALKKASEQETAESDLKHMAKSSNHGRNNNDIRFIRNQTNQSYNKSANTDTFRRDTRPDSSHINQNANCRYCGRARHQDRRDCPANGKECRSCGLKNHFSSVCLSKKF